MATDADRLTRLWLDHKVSVEKFIHRRISGSEADDCLQETFTIAWQKLDSIPVDEPLPWLYTTARNVLHNRIRGLSRAEAIPLRLAAQPISVRDFTDAAADRAQLVEAWNQLNAADQEALALTIWDGLTGIQAASVVGITRGAFAARLMRARHQLGCLLGYESTGTTDSGVNDEEPIRTIAVD